ncbi:helix-turn-helix domain-containing protein [Candidatus Saccharibacteria bacterium]|nr:MAG: helix-turn-helix domain-containing protein [Candidatus Saccharibacteria bacterium]
MQLLIREKLPLQVVANRCSVHRSTVWRWKQKWEALNENVQLTNDNRPTRSAGNVFRQAALKWLVPPLAQAMYQSSCCCSLYCCPSTRASGST